MSKLIKHYFFLFFFLGSFSCFGQGVNNNWLMGYQIAGPYPEGNTLINFFNGSPVVSFDSIEMDFRHTHANISDTAGNMLFYTNGYYIADATNDTMLNGTGINPGAYANFVPDGFAIPQSALILKKPNSLNTYYLIHSSVDNYPQVSSVAYHLYMTEIDMSLNGGLGGVVSKNVSIINDTLTCGKIASTKHANGRDWWVTVHKAYSNKFYKLLITPTAILGPYTQNIGVIRQWDAGQAWFSPDGKKYAYYYINGGLEIFDFDRCNATLSNPVHINIPFEGGYNVGMAISANSNVLYVTNNIHIYQYDLTATNILTSQIIVATYDSFMSVFPGFPGGFATYFALGSLAPDGKIYFTTGNSTIHMHTIDNPDVIGLGCSVNQHSLQIASLSYNTLPNHPNYFLGCDTTLGCGCLTTSLTKPPNGEAISARASPNPNTGIFTLQFPVQSTAGLLQIFDVMGNVIYSENIAQWSQYKKVELTTFPNGIYMCKLKWKEGSGSVKVIKE